jgi:hypothetical protein
MENNSLSHGGADREYGDPRIVASGRGDCQWQCPNRRRRRIDATRIRSVHKRAVCHAEGEWFLADKAAGKNCPDHRVVHEKPIGDG